jgi:hypothetical protein
MEVDEDSTAVKRFLGTLHFRMAEIELAANVLSLCTHLLN